MPYKSRAAVLLLGLIFTDYPGAAQTNNFLKKLDFNFGARAGLLLNLRNTDGSFSSSGVSNIFKNDTQRFVLGPTFEVGFRNRFAVEFSPTYRREGFTDFTSNALPNPFPIPAGQFATVTRFSRNAEKVWDLPVLGKFYFADRSAKIRPFLGAGFNASLRNNTHTASFQEQDSSGNRRNSLFERQSSRWSHGPVAAAGVTIRSGRFLIVPEFRYLRNSTPNFPNTRNRAEVFLGFRF